jgi:hypothetical protein
VLKVQHKPIKRSKLGFKNKGAKETEENPGLAHRTVWCTTGQCLVPRAIRLQTCHLRVSEEPLRYNSPDSLVCHRTVRCAIGPYGAPAEQQLASATVDCNGHLTTHSVRTVCAESEQPPEGALDSEQYLSGAAPDCPVPPDDKAPTVKTVRTLTVG